ncbi:MAG: DUF6228 family protein [Bacteroidota bacterium]
MITFISSGRLELYEFTEPTAEREGWYTFEAQVERGGVQARLRISDLGPERLAAFFGSAADVLSAERDLQWEALEGGLLMTCRTERTGCMLLTVQLKADEAGGWEVAAAFEVAAEQCREAAAALRRWMSGWSAG